MRLRIHQITHLWAPDQLAGAALYTDLACYFRIRGHDVRVATTFPYYPDLHFRPKDRDILMREDFFGGIPLRRIGMFLPRRHQGWRRLVPEITYLGALTVAGRFPAWTPDVVITACPMLAQVTWQRWLYLGQNIPRLVIVQDSMAHAATELGIIRNPLLGKLLHAGERWSLGAATQISTISDGMKSRVDAITGGERPCRVVPNWIHQSLADTIMTRREAAGPRLQSRLLYSGNFGVKQGLPGFLKDFAVARGEWSLAIHGGGAEAETLAREANHHGSWLTVGGLLEETDYVDRLLTTSACVVTQLPGGGANFLPSKLLPALATGTPVLAVTEAETPLGREVIEGGFGAVVPSGDPRALREVLNKWNHHPEHLKELGARALERAKLYSRERSCGAYERILLEMHEAKLRGAKRP